jgi:hypothetical protein
MLFTPWLSSVKSCFRRSHNINRRSVSRREQKPRLTLISELLEARTLLTSPQFVSISPNVGEFLSDGDERTEAPRELNLQFSPGQILQASSLGAIQIYAAGHDDGFRSASAVTDFGTGGAVVLRIGTARLGTAEDGTTLDILSADLAGSGPTIASSPGAITLTLDSNTGLPTTAERLLNFIENDPQASTLLTAEVISGDRSTDISSGTDSLVLTGAGSASALESFGTSDLRMLFVAKNTGSSGNLISLQFQRQDRGSVSPDPLVSVVGNRIEVTLNDNATNPTTASDLLAAIQSDAEADALIDVTVPVGDPDTSLAGISDGTRVQLSGADTLLVPGYRDLHPDRPNEVIYRFSQSLNDDLYRVQIVGAGTNPLTNTTSEAVNDGADSLIDFTLNLGAEVESVDPQPVLRDQIVDVLDAASITDGDLLILDPGTLANSFATVESDLDSSGAATVSFTAVQAGSLGNGLSVRISAQDLGTAGPERLPQVNVTDRIVDVIINLNPGAPTTAQELINAVNDHAVAGALLTADLAAGTANTTVGTTLSGPATLTTDGAVDLLAFEFNNTDIDPAVRSGNLTINFDNSSDANAIALAIQNAINAGPAATISRGVQATANGATVTIQGSAFDPRITLSLSDQAGVAVRAGGLTQRLGIVNVYFGQDELDASRATDPRFYRLFDTQGTLNLADDIVRIPQSVIYDNINHTATLNFGGDLPDATYRLRVGESNESNQHIGNAENVGTLFSSQNFTRVGVLGDDLGDTDVDLYRFEVAAGATITATVTPEAGVDTVLRLFDDSGSGMAIDFDDAGGAGAADTVTFMTLVGGTFYLGVSTSTNNAYDPTDGTGTMSGGATGSYFLSIASDIAISANDNNSSFGTATNVGTLGANGVTVNSQIEPQSVPLPPPAGGSDEPGHREVPAESHGAGPGTTRTTPGPLGTITFRFPSIYGVDAQGAPLINQITPAQRERTREIFEMYGALWGFEVQESTTNGIGIVTGDPRVLLPPGAPPNAVGGIAGGGLAIMNSLLDFTAQDDQFGGSWMAIAIHEIGHAIGLGHSYDIRSDQGNGVEGEDQFPGHNDIVHGRRIHPVDGTDIDLYTFQVETAGELTAEIVAERMATSSLLNSALKLYRENADGSRTLIAQNDDYFSNDPFINLTLEAGTYFIGVSSTGNTDYDPSVSDTGFNGTSDGNYQLRLSFSDETSQSLLDSTGERFDGDSDGKAGGGGFDFHFQSDTTPLIVDKSVITNLTNSISPSATTFSVTDATVFGATSGFRIQIDSEIMLVTNVVGNTLTVTRAQNGRLAAPHGTGRAIRPVDGAGNLTQPFGLISDALAAATPGDVIRIIGNGGADNDILTIDDNRPYLLGESDSFAVLEDGRTLQVPQNVVVQFDAGAIVKSQKAVIDAGSSAVGIDRSGGAIQVLGTPQREVYFTTYENDLIGGDSDGATDGANAGDWGGLIFRQDSDFQAVDAGNPSFANNPGIFLNYVNHASISFGGGQVIVDSVESTFAPIHMVTSRPTASFNTITDSAAAAMSADPDSFDDSRGRIGPDLHDNVIVDNTLNGVFLRIETQLGQPIDRLTTTARFDDTDIVHIITENLEIVGNPGGPLNGAPRPSGRLAIDPGVVVKMGASRIEGLRGNSHLIAEGTPENPVVITSSNDDRFGAGGTFDSTGNQQTTQAAARDWGGLAFNANSRLSISNAFIAFGGGETPIEGGADDFNVVEIHHGVKARIANSTFESNGPGAGGNRNGRGSTTQSTIFVRQAQPIIVNNVFRNNAGNVIDINANAMLATFQRDTGRTTGSLGAFDEFADNHGPLVRLNRVDGNGTNGMNIRGDILTTESIWDDTDIVHVLRSEITVDQHHTFSGLRLQSSPGESLVVKLQGANAGFTADGIQLDIDDRIGGTVQIVGRPGFPVILTSLHDDTVGASLDASGFPQTDTNNNGSATSPSPGDWRSLQFHEDSNDRNVRVELEAESARNGAIESNHVPGNARFLGELAPQHVTGPTPSNLGAIDTTVRADGDDNRPEGFEIHGFISADDPGDVDVYSFKGTAGNQIWIDLDRTRGAALDPVVELILADGTVVAAARYDHGTQAVVLSGAALSLTEHSYLGGDFYTFNPYDTGFRVVLPGSPGAVGTYFVRVRSNQASQADLGTNLKGGLTSGEYQLQIRTQQVDEKPGSVVRFADIRYATTGIEVNGLPGHSPLLTESIETTQANGPNQTHQPLGNLLESDRNTLTTGGTLSSGGDVDFFRFNADYATTILGPSIQSIGGVNDGGKTWTAVFDLDYADGLTRGDTTLIVYDANGVPILIGRESNIEDDRPSSMSDDSLDDLTRGSVGFLDPYIGPVQLVAGTPGSTTNYSYAVSSNSQLNRQLNQTFQSSATNPLVRLEPVNSVTRVVEDHIGFQGYRSTNAQVDPEHPNGLFDITNQQTLSASVRSFDLGDVPLYISTNDQLYVHNPLFGQQIQRVDNDFASGSNFVGDLVMRSDGTLFAYEALNNTNNSVGRLVRVDPGTGALTPVGNDNITGETAFQLGASTNNDIFDLTTSDHTGALTFRRNGPLNSGQGYWEGYYAVIDNEGIPDLGGPDPANDGFRNSKLYRFNADSGAIQNRPGVTDQGFADIQYSGVTYATTSLFVSDGNGASSSILVEANAPGTAGNGIRINVTRVTNGSGAQITAANLATRTISVQIDDGASAQNLVDAINDHATASLLVQAAISNTTNDTASNSAGPAVSLTTGGVDDPTNGVIRGNVTGLSFNQFHQGQLYGITNRGELLSINRDSGVSTLVYDFIDDPANFGLTDVDFRGLALAPQNLHDGLFATGTFSDTLFTINGSGQLVAFRIGGAAGIERVYAFGSDSEVQQLDITGALTGGTFTLTFTSDTYGPLTTGDLNFNATAAEIQAALQSLIPLDRLGDPVSAGSVIRPGDVVVTGTTADAGDIQIVFQDTGFYRDKAIAPLQVDNSALTGGTIGVSNPTADAFATASTDYGTAGAVTLDFTAVAMGAAGAGITINVTSNDLGPTGMPAINVVGQTITVTLNNNPGNESTYQDLVDTINNSAAATLLVTPNLTGNGSLQIPGTTTQATRSSNYGTTGINAVNVTYTANAFGVAGAGIAIVVQTADLGMGGAPAVAVNPAMDQITVTLNNFAGSESTAQDLVDAINMDAAASALITASLTGNGSANLGGTITGTPTVTTIGNFIQPVGSSVTGGNFNPTVGGDGIRDSWFVSTGRSGATGLAFSPNDFNLWHPTTRRGNDAGHGINPLYDLTRTPSDEDVTFSDPQGDQYNLNQQQGGTSFYFGLEEYNDTPFTPYLNFQDGNSQLGVTDNEIQRDLTSSTAIGDNYNLAGGALGSLLTAPFDLISDTGTETARDRPTLYFNYFLETENDASGDPDGEFTDSARAFISSDGGRTWNLLATNNAVRDNNSELPSFASHSRLANNTDSRQEVQELFDNTGTWRQARIDLADYVGQSGLRLRFDFSTAGTIVSANLMTNDGDLATPVDAFGSLSGDTDNYRRSRNNDFEGFYIDDIIIGWTERGEMISGATADQNYFTVPQPSPDLMLPLEILTGDYQVEVRRGFEFAANATPTDPEVVISNTFDSNIRHISGTTGVVSMTTGLPLPQTITDLFTSPVEDNFELNDTDPATFGFDPSVGWNPNGVSSNVAWNVQPTDDTGLSSNITTTLTTGLGTSLNGIMVVGDTSMFPNGQFLLFVGDEPMGGQVLTGTTIAYQRQMATAVAHSAGATVSTGTYAARSGVIGANQSSVLQVTVTTNQLTFDYKLTADSGDQFQVFVDEFGGEGGPVFTGSDTGGSFVSQLISVEPGTHTFFFVYTKDGSDTLGIDDATEGVLLDNVVFQGLSGVFIRGDRNLQRKQGHFQIESNIIRDAAGVAIDVSAAPRDVGTRLPTPGSPINFDQNNAERLAPGVVIANNVITGFGTTGILFSGDATSPGTATDPATAVPFGKIINNTIFGANNLDYSVAGPNGIGIRIENHASPTILNNIVANTSVGISNVVSGSVGPVINRTFFHGNTVNGSTGQNFINDAAGAGPLFVNVGTRNFYLDDGADAIDRSLGSLPDRTNYVAFKAQAGIPNSDVVAPQRDLFGQSRVDDTTQPPSGLGGEVFFDLGAVERADFEGGLTRLIVPEDNGVDDLDPNLTVAHIDQPEFFNQIVLQFTDAGIGIDDASVLIDGSQVIVIQTTRQGTATLVEGVDYLFAYNANTNQAILTSVTTFPSDARFEIIVDNSAATGIKDLAGNPLVQNQSDGSVRFDLLVTNGANDPPENTVPATQMLAENTVAVPTSLTFGALNGNAITVDDPDAFISDNRLRVTLAASQGSVTLPAGFGALVTLVAGTGTADTSVSFEGDIDDLNTVLDGLVFTPTLNFNGTASLTVTTNDLGSFGSEVPPQPMEDVDTILITVTPVNSSPVATAPATDMVNEDTDLNFGATLSVSDAVDGNLGEMLVTISVDQGTLTLSLSQTTGLTFQNMETGMDEATISFTGTVVDINAALNGLLYHPYGAGASPNGANQHFNGTATLTLTVDDQGNTGAGPALSAMATTEITVNPVNDAPVVNLNAAELITGAGPEFNGLERTDFVFSTANNSLISLIDVDTAEDMGVDSGKLQVTLTATNGVLDLPDAALAAPSITITAGADETTTITFDGLVAEINAVLDGMIFRPDAMFVTPDAMAGPFGTVQIDVNDGGRSGAGGTLSDSELIEINILEVNDPPVITFFNPIMPPPMNPGDPAAQEAVNEDNTLTFSSTNTTPNHFTIADSPLDMPAPGVGDAFQLTLTVSQGTLSLSGTANLSFAFTDADGTGTGDGTNDATMTFRGDVADINAALDGLVYTPGLNYRGADTLTITVNDLGYRGAGGSRTATDTVAITVSEVNDDPEINAPAVVQAVEDTNLTLSVSSGNGITVSDQEDDPTGTGTGLYQLTLELVDGDGALLLSTTSGLDFSFNDGNGVGVGTGLGGETLLRFRGTQADINAALNGLVYSPPAGVDNDTRTLNLELNDLGNIGLAGPDDGIVTASVTIQIDGNNDAPVNLVPGAQTVAEDTDLIFSTGMGNAISVTDLDAASGMLQVTLTSTNGVLTLGDAGLVTFAFAPDAQGTPLGDGVNDAAMTFRGTLGNINAALQGLVFRPALNFAGPAQIQVTTNDLGNSGVAPNNQPLSDTDTVAITVTPVNDAPAVTTQGPLTVLEDTDVTISAANANRIAVSDVDLGSGKLLVTLSVDHGTLRLFRTTGLVFSTGDGVNDRTMTFSGGLSAVNLALDGMIYTPDPGYVGMDTLSVELDDQGSTGTGGPMMTSQDLPITVTPANDAPVLTVPVTQSTNEDVALTFAAVNGNAITVADVDVNETMGGEVEVTLGVTSGTLALSTTSGLTGDTDGSDGTLLFRGSINAVNVALSGLRYTPMANFSGTDTLSIDVSDLGNTGAGGIGTDNESVTINVASVNDAPVNTLQVTTAMVSEDPLSPLEFSTGNANLISVSDADVLPAELVQVTLSVSNGTLSLSGTSGLTFSFSDANGTGAGTGSSNASMTFRGTLADVNAALDGLDYQPNPDFSGNDTLTVTTNDLGQNGSGGAKTDTDTLAITVVGQNDAPVAVEDSFSVLVGSFVNGNVLTNDSDVDGPSLAVVNPLVTDVSNGTLNLNFVTGEFTYTPDTMTTATSDSFQYTVTDGLLAGNTVTVTFAINAPPAISGATFALAENSGSGTAVGTLSVSDPNMDGVSLSIIAGNTSSAFAIDNDGNITVNNPAALDFEVTPTFTLTVRATDNAATPGSSDATVIINLTDAAESVTIDAADFAAASGNVTVRRDGTKVRFVNTGSGLDIPGALAHEFANVTSLTFIGQTGVSDTLTVDFATGNPLPAGGLSYEGGSGAGSDALVLEDGGAVTFSNVTHTFASSSSGTVDVDGQLITYTGLEPIADNLDATNRVFNFGPAADDVLISNAADGDSVSTISSMATSESVTFDTSGATITVNLGDGADTLQAIGLESSYSGTLTVNAGNGNDVIDLSGISANSFVNGDDGNDTITGGSGNDQVVGNAGDDVVNGGAGDDNVIGGAGRDTVSGGSGNNMVDGNGTSFDVLVENVAGNVVLTDGTLTWDTGSNTLNRIEGVVLIGSSGADSLDASGFTLFGVRLEGGDGDDTIQGTSLNDVIFAGSGADLVTANAGNDIVFGEAGDDLLIGNAGDDQLNGDDGNDRILGGSGVDTLSGGLGNDDIDGQGATGDVLLVTASGSSVTVSAGSIVHGTEADVHNRVERIEVTLDDSDNHFDGGDYTGRLFVYGLGGNDTILGGLGADVIFAGLGDDIVDGREGNDIVYAGSGADAVRGGAGIDRLIGNADDDTLLGSDGNDFLFGGAGRDLILGENGDDLIKGQGGRDNLAGGGNGTVASPGDAIVPGTGDTIDDAFSFDFDALLI